MESFFRSGQAIDLILAIVVAEAMLLGWWLARRGRGGELPQLLLGLLPGVCLFMALRAALTGADWFWIALWVTLSLPAHLADMARRIRQAR